ncbi:programmed cell death 6-interacting protein isoform X1 [Helicoverpa zea]|uniref:programmed cell death 6-interacting protein isoform X1 n=1 Tax=Helicoverpa zea TaxID=7113 RepID=UPI001F5AD931|nr:programmed cell death 6-interacting protein isoform X1 [Helicoverpa zea]
MAAELLFVPFKKSSDVDIVKPLRNLINSTYNTGDHHEDYTEALNELSRLRANAIWKVFEKTSLDIIYNYHDQLASLEAKVPPQEVQIPFKWKDAFDKGSLFGGRMSLTISSLAYERMCILFNIAAMQSLIASQQPVETEESLKQAAKLFQQAAGVFLYLKANIMMAVHQETTPDLHPETLDALAKLMLAQAQEVIAFKCIRDEMKDSMVAKVCAQCEELYTDALRAMQKDQLKSLWERDWLLVMASKQQAFRGLAQLHQAQVCHAAKSVGEEIARLALAEELLRGAARGGGWLGEQAARAARALAAARRDNDFIYHERVPEPAALEPLARAAVAKALPPPPRWGAARDLFAALVPHAVHAALQAAAARRADLVAREVAALRDATQLLNAVLAELSLPACLEGAGAGALPDSIRARAQAVRDAGGLPELSRLMAELPELLQRNRDILDEAERMLREEAEADSALRQQFGARWARTESAKLTDAFRANADKYRQIIDNAVRADAIVQQKLAQHRDNIALLGGSEQELSAGVPDAPERDRVDAGAPDAVQRLRQLCADVEELKAERDAIEAELKDTTVDLRERFLAALAADGAVDEPALSAGALGAALAPLQRRAAATLARQAELLAALQAAHSALTAARGGASGRDAALGRLAAAADAFQELTANLNEGIKFYNDLTQLLVAFQNKVSDFCFARKTEKDELLKDLTQEASRGSVRPAPAPPQHHAAAEQPSARREPPPRPPPPAAAPGSAPAAAPGSAPAAAPGSAPAAAAASLPYPQQPQGMPVPYGAGAAYPYYGAPVPQLYNPYATLPYPSHARMPPPQPYQPYQYPAPAPFAPQPPPAGYNPYPPQ